MKKLALQMAALSLAAGFLTAQSGPMMTANVPFDFMAGDKTLAAGEYTVRTDASKIVWIQAKNSAASALLITQLVRVEPTAYGMGTLTFNKYGDRYFLSKVSAGASTGNEVIKSRAEREYVNAILLAKTAKPTVVTLAAK